MLPLKFEFITLSILSKFSVIRLILVGKFNGSLFTFVLCLRKICYICCLCQKLRLLKVEFNTWNKTTFGDVHLQVSKAQQAVNNLEHKQDANKHISSFMPYIFFE